MEQLSNFFDFFRDNLPGILSFLAALIVLLDAVLGIAPGKYHGGIKSIIGILEGLEKVLKALPDAKVAAQERAASRADLERLSGKGR